MVLGRSTKVYDATDHVKEPEDTGDGSLGEKSGLQPTPPQSLTTADNATGGAGARQLCEAAYKYCVVPFQSEGQYFVLRKLFSLVLEAGLQLALIAQRGDTGVSAFILALHVLVIMMSLNTPWFLTSDSPRVRQIIFVVLEVIVDVLFVVVHLLPFLLDHSKFEYAATRDCNSALYAGFGAFLSGCYDVGLRQQTLFAFKTLVSETNVALIANAIPLFGLAVNMEHLLTQVAKMHGGKLLRPNPAAAKKPQYILPRGVAVLFSLASVVMSVHVAIAVFTSKVSCVGIEGCTRVAHPLQGVFDTGCACVVFQSPTCTNLTGLDLALAAERGFLNTVVVGEKFGYSSYSDCHAVTDVPWDSLTSKLEIIALMGTHAAAPAKLSSENLVALAYRVDPSVLLSNRSQWKALPHLPSTIAYVNVEPYVSKFDPGDWRGLKALQYASVLSAGLTSPPDISESLQLEYIGFTSNQLAVLPNLSEHKKLRCLLFGNNLVTALPLLPPSLTTLHAYQNRLNGTGSLRNLPKLREARLENNRITTKPFLKAPPPGLELIMAGNPVCDTCGPVDCGICEIQCSPGCGMGLLGDSKCDERCDVEQCGYDQAMCQQSVSILPCTEWCTSAGLQFFKSLDVDLDGTISGDVEVTILKSVYYHPALEQEGIFLAQGVVAFFALDVGLAPIGSNCWGCNITQMYQDGGFL
jgi:hypothetical protein